MALVTHLPLHVQALGVRVLSALPYAGMALMLALISRHACRIPLRRPAMLGQPFQPRA